MKYLFLLSMIVWTNSLFSFSVSFPDSPVVITELASSHSLYLLSPLSRTLVRDSKGNIYVVCSFEDSIKVFRSTGNGATWRHFASPGWKTRWYCPGVYSPTIAIDSGDTIYVAWHFECSEWDSIYGWTSRVYWSKFNGITWTKQESLTQHFTSTRWNVMPSLAVDSRNQAHAVWSGGYYIFGAQTIVYTYLKSDGTWNWPLEDVGEHPPWSWFPNIIADVNNNIHLGYQFHGYYLARYRKRYANLKWGPKWGPIEDVSIPDSANFSPSVTVVPGETISHVTFNSMPFPPPHISHVRLFYRYKPDSVWSKPFELIPFRLNWYPGTPCITADSQGNLYTAWELLQTYDGNNIAAWNIWMRRYKRGPGWEEPFKVTNDTIPLGKSGVWNNFPSVGYPVTENGVDITWFRTTWDSINGQRQYLMYKRVPSLLGIEQEKEKFPSVEPELTLSPRPNPSRWEIELVYSIPREENINLTIYNILGERVRTLFHGQMPAGVYRVRWNGKDEKLREVASGTYFFQLSFGKKQIIKKGILIR